MAFNKKNYYVISLGAKKPEGVHWGIGQFVRDSQIEAEKVRDNISDKSVSVWVHMVDRATSKAISPLPPKMN